MYQAILFGAHTPLAGVRTPYLNCSISAVLSPSLLGGPLSLLVSGGDLLALGLCNLESFSPLPLAPHPGVAGGTPSSSFFSPPTPQPSASQPLSWPWPPLLSWLSKPHALYDRLPLPLAVEGGTSAPLYAVIASPSAAPQVFQCHSGKGRSGWGKT